MTREEIIAKAKPGHDAVCHCDPKYLMSCPNMANAILALASPAEKPADGRMTA
jgi:hypothetical protein